MEKEEQKWEQEEVEEEQEEEASLEVRKSKPVNETGSTESAIVETENNNGTSESNEHEIQPTVTANGTKDFESTLGNGEGKDELDVVVGNEEEDSNGLQKSDTLVFFEEDEGIWKCRICSWIYGNGSSCVDHSQNHKGQLHKLMNDKTLNNEFGGNRQQYRDELSVFMRCSEKFDPHNAKNYIRKHPRNPHKFLVDIFSYISLDIHILMITVSLKGNRRHDRASENSLGCICNDITPPNSGDQQIEESNGHNELDILSREFDALHNSMSTVNGGSGGHLNDDNFSYSDHQHNGIREGGGLSNWDLKSSGEIECEEVYVVPGDELEVTEIDVEQVLHKQTTHDLFCPNCNSCITRRVILRKRKRGVRLSAQDIKRNKLEAVADSKLDADSFQVSSTCGNGFKLFRIFEGKKVKVNIKDEQVSSTKKNWFISMLTFNKPGTAVARVWLPGYIFTLSVIKVLKGEKNLWFQSHAGSKSREDVRKRGNNRTLRATSDQLQESKFGKKAQMNHGTNLSTKTPPSGPHFTNGESSEDDISSSKGNDGEVIQIMATPVSVLNDVDGRLDISLAVPHEDHDVEATIVTESVVENEKTNFQSDDDGQVYPAEVSQHTVTKTKFEVHAGESLKIDGIPSVNGVSTVQGKDTVITIDARPVGSSQTGQNIVYPEETNSALHSAPQVTVADAEGTEVRNESEIEVIKSIVYGGLAESITSLGVVSSAAGGGAATLKIVALGIASLMGGFFVICQNLWELRSECTEQALNHVSPVIERRDRYKELLGQKENFVMHATVSILSYIIFGLVAPVAYGFSFRKSDNKEFKLILVAAASLLCICGLAVGRAYVRRPPRPYLKSVVTYVLLGFMVSGISYVAGVLVERILDKLGLFHSSSGANLLIRQMETVPSNSGYWTSH
ncbi:membrane protein of ER body-like protein [Primulina eburnea]|uniref:membrane protein of ER body-like protein n=1 Tax=Primulina eburnea TaxID=1245227 RepID=UPI003C6CAF20